MSGYSTRLRQLEARLGGGQCPLCAGYPAIDFVTVHGDEPTPPAPPPCTACGKLATRFIVHHAADTVARSQQPAAEPFSPRAPSAESVPPAPEHNARAESRSKPRVRRRQYNGPR